MKMLLQQMRFDFNLESDIDEMSRIRKFKEERKRPTSMKSTKEEKWKL